MTDRAKRIVDGIAAFRTERDALVSQMKLLAPITDAVADMSELAWTALKKTLPSGWANALMQFRGKADGT